ncbi:Tudor domain protein [Aphelenchoides bicaudatus]|nr:Tudor domain protein [Aphelenchoides bicaudatus]
MPEHHPATRCMRANSPYTIRLSKSQRDVHNNKFALANDEGKIHRIFLKDETEVEFLNLVSPSCIWVRLTKNVAENLDLRAPYPMKQALQFERDIALKNSIKEYDYYMAPRILSEIADDESDNFAYSRARVLQIKNLEEGIYCYAFYIDYAYGNWVKADSLGIMPKRMKTMPWQAIPVSLMGVSPAKSFDITKDKYKWTREQCQILHNIMKKYKRFDAKPFTCKLLNIADYNHYARVELEALIDKDAEFEEEIDENDVIPQINDDEISDENGRANSVPKQKSKVLFKPVKVSVNYEFYSESRVHGEPIVISAHYDELTTQKLFDVENEEADADSEIPALDPSLLMSERYRGFPDEKSLTKTDEDIAAEKSAELKRQVERQEAEIYAKGNIEEEQQIKDEIVLEHEKALREWDIAFYEYLDTLPEYAKPLTPQVSKLKTSLEAGDQFYVILNSTSLNSPYDFYGHLLKSFESARDCQNAMIEVPLRT